MTALLTHNSFKIESVKDRMHKEIKSILCNAVREETIGCFSEVATSLNLKTEKNQNVIVHI